LLARLADSQPDSVRLAEAVSKFVDEAGTEPALRRHRLRWVLGFAADLYRQAMRIAGGGAAEGDAELSRAATALGRATLDTEVLAGQLERTLDAIAQVGRNANQSALVFAWLDEMVHAPA
jgi:hypothetical protein